VECWDKTFTAAQRSTGDRAAQVAVQYSTAAGLGKSDRSSFVCRAAGWLACLLLLLACLPEPFNSLHLPSRLASNATHNQPRPHPRLHRPRCSSARSQQPSRAHCTTTHNATSCTAPHRRPSLRPRRAHTSSCRPRVCAAVANNARRKPSASVRAHPSSSPSPPLRRVESSATGA